MSMRTKKKSMISLILCFLFLVASISSTLAPQAAIRANTLWGGLSENVWDGSVPSSGPVRDENNTYTINTAADLVYVLNKENLTVENADSITVKLAADIYFNNIDNFDSWDTASGTGLNNWTSYNKTVFAMTIDGDGHKIYGLYSKNPGGDAGLIVNFSGSRNLTFKNVGIDYSYIEGTTAGAFMSTTKKWATVNFEKCFVGENVTVKGNGTSESWVGGFVGVMPDNSTTVAFRNCYSLVSVSGADEDNIGSFLGRNIKKEIVIEKCYTNSLVEMIGYIGPNHGDYTGHVTDASQNYAPDAFTSVYSSKVYTTAVPVENMKGIEAAKSMSGLGDTYITTEGYPTLAIFIPEDKRTNDNVLFGGSTDITSDEHMVLQDYDVARFGENRFANQTYSAGFYINGNKTYEYVGDVDPTIETSVLCAWHNAGNSACNIRNAPNDIIQTDSYWQWQVIMSGNVTDPEKFVIYAHKTYKGLMSQHYAVYASTGSADLFNDENKIFEITDTTPRLGDSVDLKNLGIDLKNIKTFGIRFYHRGYTIPGGCTGQHITQIGVYGGSYKQDSTLTKYYNDTWSYAETKLAEDLKNYEESLIQDKEPYLTKLNGGGAKRANYKKITDGKFDSHQDIGAYKGQKDGAFDIIYKLDENPDIIKQIEKFVMRSCSVNNSFSDPYVMGKYEIYAAVNYTELFDQENRIYDYDYQRDGLYRTQEVLFQGDAVYARYVALRVINPVSTCKDISYIYPRITEIVFLGKEVNVEFNEVELTPHMPLEVYFTDKNGKSESLGDELTIDMLSDITDMDDSTSVSFNAKNKQIDFIINLCKDFDITKAAIIGKPDLKYDVYLAENFAGLFEESSKATGESLANKSKTARYVRISVSANQGDTVEIKDISLMGLSNPLIERYEHISYSMDTTKIITFIKPNNLKSNEDLIYKSGNYSNLFNSEILGESMVIGGETGVSTLNILVNFSTLQNVNEISLYFPPNLRRYQPTKVKIYLAETYEDAMNMEKSSIHTFTGLPKYGKYNITVKPTLARYLRIEFVENNYGKNIVNSFTNENDEDFFNGKEMHIAISEIDIMGTSVIGMADENGVLLSYSDKATGIKWDILALDENDVIPNIYSSELLELDATNAQMASLYREPYYNVVNRKVYQIEFYDFFGNKLDNIGFRQLCITVPTSAGAVSSSIIGDAASSDFIELLDTNSLPDQNAVYSVFSYNTNLKFALLDLTDENDSYWNTVDLSADEDNTHTDSDYEPAPPDDGEALDNSVVKEENEEPEMVEVNLGTEVKHTVSYTVAPTWLIVITVVQAVLLLGVVGTILFIHFKGKAGRSKI